MAKTSGTKLRLLHVKRILEEHTDENHGITRARIGELLAQQGQYAERKTIYEDINALRDYGMEINYDAEKMTYNLAERDFSLWELKMIIDSIQSSKFLSEKETRNLIGKLERLCSNDQAKELHRDVVVIDRVKSDNGQIHTNINNIQEALAANQQIAFSYFHYDTRKRKVYSKKRGTYVVSPWRLIYTDDNYYLLAYDAQGQVMRTFRTDRMEKLSCVPVERVGREAYDVLDMADYTKYTFGMFDGEIQNVTLEFQNLRVDAVLDRFGHDVFITPSDKNHFRITVPVAVSNQFFAWLLGLGNYVRIVSPESVKAAFQKRLDDASERNRRE